MQLWLYKTIWALEWDSGTGKNKDLHSDTLRNLLLLIRLFYLFFKVGSHLD